MASVSIRQGDMKERRLPPFCVVTGDPTTSHVTWRAGRVHSPISLLLLLFGILPYVIYLAATSRSVVLQLPATDAVARRLRADRKLYWGIGIAGFVMTFGGVFISTAVAIVGVVAMAGALVLRLYLQGRDWVWAHLESDGVVVIGGCSETFADAVETWRPAGPSS